MKSEINLYVFGFVVGLLVFVSADDFKFECPKDSNYFFYPCVCEGGDAEGIIVSCENANLPSISQGLSNIRLPISRLHLRKCNMRKLYGGIFGTILLRRLFIEDVPIQSIGEEVFEGVQESLKEVYIKGTDMRAIPKAALMRLKHLEVLEISDVNLTNIGAETFPPFPKLEKLSLQNCNISSIHKDAFKTISNNLVKIHLSHNQLKDLPKGVFQRKKELKVLDLAFNNFTNLDTNYFQDLNKLTWCNMSNNAITSFGRSPFVRNAALGWLSLSHNLLTEVPANTFRSLRTMRRLYLSDNKIKKVARSAFNNLKRIGTIDLSRNEIPEVDIQTFEDFQHCEIINLAENKIKIIRKHAFKELYLVAINMSHNLITTFENESFVNTVNITVLDMSHNLISEIHREAFPGERSSYMTEWRLEYNNITDLSKIPLHFHGLKILNVSYNTLKVIPKNTFPKLYELHTIDASHGEVTEIGRAAFSSLFSIRYIDLSYNLLEKLSGGVFGSMPTLLRLDLSFNRINMISRGMFASLISIRELFLNDNSVNNIFQLPQSLNDLNLNNNNISFIKPREFPQMNALLFLHLANNNLGDTIGPGTFQNLNSLRNLNLANNSITEPPWQALSEMQTLQHLNFEGNKIQSLSRSAFGRLNTIFEINLANNGLTNVSKQAFDGLLQLLTLNFSNNNLHSIPNEAFRGLVSLRTLDLSNNFLNKVDNNTHGLFDDLLSVNTLNLSRNSFEIISKKMFPYHKYIPYNIQNVDLSFNQIPILHKNLLIGLQKVKRFNISHNILNEIRPGVLGNLSSLEVIDLSHNDLSALSVSVFGKDKLLKEVYLQNNSLVSVPASVLISNKNLTLVDLRDNKLTNYYPEFVWKAVNGTRIRYNRNPVECDCVLRPLRSWLSTFLNSSTWEDIICDKPLGLQGRPLSQINEIELRCPDKRDLMEPEFQLTPDIKFRSLQSPLSKVQRPLDVSWYVTTRDDVGSFSIVLRNVTSNVQLLDETVPYTTRNREYPGFPEGLYQLCVGAKTSLDEQRTLKPSQCVRIELSNSNILEAKPLLIVIFNILLLCYQFKR